MSDAHLIDTLLGARAEGTGERLLQQWHTIPQIVQNVDALDITEVQREKLRAAFALHILREPREPQICTPDDAYPHVCDLAAEPVECLVVLVLNSKNRIIHREDVYRGSVNQSQIRIAEVLRPAIIRNAPSIIIAHNHPSGDPHPSPEDVIVTKNIADAAKTMSIALLDHLVIGGKRYISMKTVGAGGL